MQFNNGYSIILSHKNNLIPVFEKHLYLTFQNVLDFLFSMLYEFFDIENFRVFTNLVSMVVWLQREQPFIKVTLY